MTDNPGPTSAPSAEPSSLRKVLVLFPAITLPMFLAMVDGTIVAAALPAIAGDLGNASRVSWVVTAYLVAATIAAPVYGRLGDVLGRKRLMVSALLILMGGSILCAVAPNMELLTLARVLQGVGGGGMMTLSQALIGEAVPPRERARYQGILSTIAVSANAFGAVAGGLLTASFGWRSIFVVNLPLGLIALFLLRRLPTRAGPGGAMRFDAAGLGLFAAFIVSILTLLGYAQEFTAESLLPIIGLFVLCIAVLVLLIRTENRVKQPLFPIAMFRNPSIWRCDGLAICHGAVLVSLITFLPIFFRASGADAASIGFLLLPVTVGVPVGSIITGQIVGLTGRAAIFPSVGLVVVVLIFGAIALWLPHLGTTEVAWLLGACALFIGTVMGVVQVTVQTAAGPTLIGTAAASVQYSRSIGAAVGTATVSAVLFATLAAQDSEAARMFVAVLQQGTDVLLTLGEARRVVVQAEIAGAFRAAFLTMAGFATIGIALAWTLPIRRI